jgi:hypothetical protein
MQNRRDAEKKINERYDRAQTLENEYGIHGALEGLHAVENMETEFSDVFASNARYLEIASEMDRLYLEQDDERSFGERYRSIGSKLRDIKNSRSCREALKLGTPQQAAQAAMKMKPKRSSDE